MSNDTTIKSHGGPLEIAENELEAARTVYLKAYEAYIEQRTVVNRNAMYDAYKELSRIRALYTDGRRTLIAHALKKQVPSSPRGTL